MKWQTDSPRTTPSSSSSSTSTGRLWTFPTATGTSAMTNAPCRRCAWRRSRCCCRSPLDILQTSAATLTSPMVSSTGCGAKKLGRPLSSTSNSRSPAAPPSRGTVAPPTARPLPEALTIRILSEGLRVSCHRKTKEVSKSTTADRPGRSLRKWGCLEKRTAAVSHADETPTSPCFTRTFISLSSYLDVRDTVRMWTISSCSSSVDSWRLSSMTRGSILRRLVVALCNFMAATGKTAKDPATARLTGSIAQVVLPRGGKI